MNRRGKMMLQMIFVLHLLFTSVTCAVMNVKSIFAPINEDSLMRSDDVCETDGCKKAAADILANLDEKTEPCDNFYQFACGGYLDKRVIKDDRSDVSTFSDVQDELDSKIKELLNASLTGSEPKFIPMIKNMYDSCMNLESIESSGSEPLTKILNSLGGWPVTMGDQWDGSNFDWMESLITMRKLGYSQDILMDLSVNEDSRDNTVHIIELDQASLGISDRSYYMSGFNDSTTEAYYKLMVKAANKLGANEATSEKELMKAFEFETSLANFSMPREERRNMSRMYNKYTVKQLQEFVPQIDWLKYFNGLLNDPITEDDVLIVDEPEFVKKFGELIAQTDKRIVANYMLWRVVMTSMEKLSKDWRDLAQEYSTVVTGESTQKPRWEQCLGSLGDYLGMALGSYYVRNYFKDDSRQLALDMVNYILKEFLKILNNIDWMEETTKVQAREKVNAITPFIGYPPELLNDSLVIEHYEKLVITSESYFNNIQNVKKWFTDYSFSKLRQPNIKGDWRKHADAAMVNAFYDPLGNSIDFPAGILQNAFFNKDRPNYLNFGAIGFVIGHEITHGFDDQGRQFDKDGNNVNWWDDSTDTRFKEKAKCIIYQYGNYTAENGMKLDGVNSQGENIADNGGLKEAYWAYHAWVKVNGHEKKLPGLKYTPNQLFWISAANVWCGKYRPELLKLMITSGAHSPPEFRVKGPLSNFPEFAKEFQCSPGSNMNPENKCQVW